MPPPYASLTGAIKATIEAAGLSLVAYRDNVGDGTPGARYVTIDEGVSITTVALGDAGASDEVTELVQVNLWQPWRAKSPAPAEDYALPNQLYNVLHGARLTGAPKAVTSCRVDDVVRIVETASNKVHHAFTLRVVRAR